MWGISIKCMKYFRGIWQNANTHLKVFVPGHHLGQTLPRWIFNPRRENQGALQALSKCHHTKKLVRLVAKPKEYLVFNSYIPSSCEFDTFPCKGNKEDIPDNHPSPQWNHRKIMGGTSPEESVWISRTCSLLSLWPLTHRKTKYQKGISTPGILSPLPYLYFQVLSPPGTVNFIWKRICAVIYKYFERPIVNRNRSVVTACPHIFSLVIICAKSSQELPQFWQGCQRLQEVDLIAPPPQRSPLWLPSPPCWPPPMPPSPPPCSPTAHWLAGLPRHLETHQDFGAWRGSFAGLRPTRQQPLWGTCKWERASERKVNRSITFSSWTCWHSWPRTPCPGPQASPFVKSKRFEKPLIITSPGGTTSSDTVLVPSTAPSALLPGSWVERNQFALVPR